VIETTPRRAAITSVSRRLSSRRTIPPNSWK
jgi:hypothetical protein